MRSVVTLVTAPAGSGKTYDRVRSLVDEFLPETEGHHWGNLPIRPAKIAEYLHAGKGLEPSETLARLHQIPEHVLRDWIRGQSGPWDFFNEQSLDGGLISIDEVHNFCGKKKPKGVIEKWQNWLGEVRHRGCRVELISQHPQKIADQLRWEAEAHLVLVNSEQRRDPLCGILLGDWYELRAAFVTREYKSAVWLIEKRSIDGKMHDEDKRVFWFRPEIFELYDSYSQPHTGGVKASAPVREFEKRTRRGLAWWFVKRNALRLSVRAVVVALLVWMVGFGGGGKVFEASMASFRMAGNRTAGGKLKPKPDGRAALAKVDPSKIDHNPAPHLAKIQRQLAGAPERKSILVPPAGGKLEPIARKTEPTALERRLDDVMAKVEALLKERSDVLKAVGVKLLTPDGAQIDGSVYRLGEVVTSGPFRGRKLVAVNWKGRKAVLNDGTVLQVGLGADVLDSDGDGAGGGGPGVSSDATGAAEVRTDLPGGGGVEPVAARGVASQGAKAVPSVPGSAPPRNPAVSGAGNGSVDRGGAKLRR